MTQQQDTPQVTGESSAVQSYLGILQNIISRMASNSSNCKTWCISLASAILVVIADKKTPDYVWIAFIPVVLFFLLDAYYLGQERAFRDVYNDFVVKLHTGGATSKDLFVIRPMEGCDVVKALSSAGCSFATYPFYLVLAGIIIIAHYLIL
jgi:hypothetical protein